MWDIFMIYLGACVACLVFVVAFFSYDSWVRKHGTPTQLAWWEEHWVKDVSDRPYDI
jgi:hypothetical protein